MKKIADLRGHTSRVLHLALSPDGTTVASAAADETLRFWKVFQASQSTKKSLLPTRQAANLMRDPSQFLTTEANSSTTQGSDIAQTAHNNISDILMTDCSKFFQTSPSQFNGYSLRWTTIEEPSFWRHMAAYIFEDFNWRVLNFSSWVMSLLISLRSIFLYRCVVPLTNSFDNEDRILFSKCIIRSQYFCHLFVYPFSALALVIGLYARAK